MGIALMFLLALYQMQSAIHSEIIESPNYSYTPSEVTDDASSESTAIDTDQLGTLMPDKTEQAELQFRYPISAIGIDYSKNSVLLRFQKYPQKQRYKYDSDWAAKRRSLKDNFLHFGKRQAELLPRVNSNDHGYFEQQLGDRLERSLMGGRDSRGDNFMRFGRSDNFMRFGRNPNQRPDNFLRFGRAPKQRPDNFLRFGRMPKQTANDQNDRSANFMRFGKSVDVTGTTDWNQTKPQQQKNEIRAAAKLLKQTESGLDESNPVDKAITLLFSKHQQRQQEQQQTGHSEQTELENGNNLMDQGAEQFYEAT